jgi:hypothetical protein
MSNTKWLRRALLGGVALSVMATGAQADELSALKAQLEALQSRVNTLESAPAAALPEGYSLMTYTRGAGSNSDWGNESKRDSINVSNDRGFTVSVTPTADMPAPVAEVTVYGYVKGDVIWTDQDVTFDLSRAATQAQLGNDESHITLHAKQSRFGIKSKVDTAIGQIRTQIEGDFEGSPYGANDALRLRHAFGQWDMNENWTLTVGQYWHIAALLPIGVTTVDFAGPAGFTYSRAAQVRLDYSNGPFSMGFGIERPRHNTNSELPDFAAYIQYDIPGGHQFIVTGNVADQSALGAGFDDLAWVMQAGVNINMADMGYITIGGLYGDGIAGKFINGNHIAVANGQEAWSIHGGINFGLSDTTSVNVAVGYAENEDTAADAFTVHANLIWSPVKQMRMGWEVFYGDNTNAAGNSEDMFGAQFGTWFFF